ncbi:MAG: DMT family transporter [Thermodesulfovibrionales bacterium]
MPSLSILLAIFLWSSLGVIVRLAGVSETVIIFYSSAVAVAIQGIIIAAGGWARYVPDKRTLKYPAMLGCVGLLNTFAFYYAFRHTTIANAVLAHYIAPVLVAFLAAYFLGEKATKALIIAIALSSTGLLIMLGGFSAGSSDTAGIIAGLISGCAYAVLIIMARVYTQQLHPLVMSFVPNVVIMILLAPFVREFPVHALWSIIVIGVVHSTIAPLLYYWGMKEVTANKTAVLGYLEPVTAIIFSMVFLKEMPALKSLAGGGLIIFSGYLTLRGKDKAHPGL